MQIPSTKKQRFLLLLSWIMAVYAQAQFSPSDIGGLEIWLDADSGVTLVDDLVSQWNDRGPQLRNAVSVAPSIRPSLLTSDINGHNAISFDGVYDFLEFPEITNGRTFFWIIKENETATNGVSRPLLGWSGGLNFLRGYNREFWEPTFSHPGVAGGITRLNQQIINGTTTAVPTTYALTSLLTSSPVQASHITMEWNIYGRTWWGEIAELLVYSDSLTMEEVQSVENYLATKYGPPAPPMADIQITDRFCETQVCAPAGFVSYQWSSGENTNCISVSQSGEYSVMMADQFGRTVYDTLFVQFPGNTELPDTNFICLGNTFEWNTELDNANFNFDWSNDQITPDFQTATQGIYDVVITDNFGCSKTVSFEVMVDSLSDQLTLGQDVSLCSGNSIGIDAENFEGLTMLWNTLDTTETIVVLASGEYAIAVNDIHNCTASDTIQVTVLGTAPVIDFSSSGLCEEQSTTFVASSTDNITSWTWTFNDGTPDATGANVNHTFDDPGNYIVTLNAIAASGCTASHDESIHIFSKPVPNYITSSLCNNLDVIFNDQSFSSEGIVNNWSWLINGSFYSSENVTAPPMPGGFQNITLSVTDNHGCAAELNNFIDVKFAPDVSFDVNGVCQGTLTSFDENVDAAQSGNITHFVWNFGDNTGSLLPTPTHYYPDHGNYPVTLNATAINGCVGTLTDTITLFNNPIADFEINNACINAPFVFHNTSSSDVEDPIQTWSWVVQDEFTLEGSSPMFVFQNEGLVPVTLHVITSNGCNASVAQQIPVWAKPVAAFSHTPEIGAAPLDVQFILETENVQSVHWFFGDTHESEELNPEHTYTFNSTFLAQLVVTNNAGCRDTTAHYVTIAEPHYDIALPLVDWIETANGYQLKARISNTGNIPVNEILLSWQVGNDAPVLEEWTGELLPGATFEYEFHSYLQIAGQQFPYVCVVVEPSPIQYTEINKTDNEICKPLSNSGLELFPPFPNPGDDRMFVRFISPIDGDLEIRVYDVNGRLAMELTDMQVPKGFHQYFIDISALASGSYRLSLEMGSIKAVTSFMKVKK